MSRNPTPAKKCRTQTAFHPSSTESRAAQYSTPRKSFLVKPSVPTPERFFPFVLSCQKIFFSLRTSMQWLSHAAVVDAREPAVESLMSCRDAGGVLCTVSWTRTCFARALLLFVRVSFDGRSATAGVGAHTLFSFSRTARLIWW